MGFVVRWFPWRLALTVAVAAAVLAPGFVLAQAEPQPGWRIVRLFPVNDQSENVAATGTSDAWAAGSTGCGLLCGANSVLVWHWDGKAWRTVHPPGQFTASPDGLYTSAVAASSSSNAWVIVGENSPSVPDYSYALHWSGRSWAPSFRFPARSDLLTAVAPARASAWALGEIISPFSIYAAHYDGKRWSRVRFPIFAMDADALSATDIWVIGDTDPPNAPLPPGSRVVIVHWNGRSWRQARLPRISLPKGDVLNPLSIVAIAPGNVWASGFPTGREAAPKPGSTLLHWNGKTWMQAKIPYRVDGIFPAAPDGVGGLWLLGFQHVGAAHREFLYHDINGRWSRVTMPVNPGHVSYASGLAWIPGTRSIWGVGVQYPLTGASTAQGLILKYGP